MHSKERKHAVILKNVSLKIDICKKDIGCGDSRDHSRFKFQDRHPNLSLTLATNSTRTSVTCSESKLSGKYLNRQLVCKIK